jgi:hypothetical protein
MKVNRNWPYKKLNFRSSNIAYRSLSIYTSHSLPRSKLLVVIREVTISQSFAYSDLNVCFLFLENAILQL